jgi:molybdopterin/thiamine biosynthesis adenylyltransferase
VSATAAEGGEEWYERSPERLQWELAAFETLGLPAVERVAEDGRLRITTELPYDGASVAFDVYFPPDYPDFAPTVRGPAGLLPRHQVRGRYICLLEDPPNDWWPGWAAAQLIDTQLRGLLEASERGPEAVAAVEADMVESISAQISYTAPDAVLVPDPFWAPVLDESHGEFTLLQTFRDSLHVLSRVQGCGLPDKSLTEHLVLDNAPRSRGLWVSLPEPPPLWPSGLQVLDAARSGFPDLFGLARQDLVRKYRLKEVDQWVAVTFLEEGPRRGQTRRAWVFAEVRLSRTAQPELLQMVEANPVTRQSRALRTPELVGLDAARIVVIGGGSLGSAIALELAKAGVGELAVVDGDLYQAANSVRHVLPIIDTGRAKATAVAWAALELNPLITVLPHMTRINGGNADQLLADADVVVDTTGSQAVGRLLSRHCRKLGATLVVADLTNGAHGGEVVILDPNGACFMCFVLRQAAGEIPSPTSGERSNATAHGCGYPTFTGAGFDATALAATAARAIVGLRGWCDYPTPDYDWLVLNFRGGQHWQQGRLERHPDCPLCGSS